MAITVAVVGGVEALPAVVSPPESFAVVHAGDAPTVDVTATVDAETATLRIADDGDGIPELEREVVTGDTDITQLSHSRGLGLWLAYYAVTAVGGDLSFVDPATVVLDLPRED